MKKINLFLGLIMLIFAAQSSFAQVARTSWSFGFGFGYPTFFSTDVRAETANYGGFISIQHNFYENIGLRFMGSYNHMEGLLPTGRIYFLSNGAVAPTSTKMHTNLMGGDLDLLYYFTPCNVVSPYAGFGIGVASFKSDWGNVVNVQAVSKTAMEMNVYFGSEWRMSPNWNLKTEIGYHTTDGQVDGVVNNNRQGIFGSDADSYVTLGIGLQYYFHKGEPSKYCELYSGIKAKAPAEQYPTLEQIEDMIKRHIPKVVEKKIEVEKPVKGMNNNWILFGVNFDVAKSSLRPEAYPILEHAVDVLRENENMKVEIQGYTDNTGSVAANQKLSLQRAKTVKNYLVKHGISGDRLTTVGYGEKDPIASNSTDLGRAQNRRIEFKILK